MFIVIWIIILILQVLITQFTQDVFRVARDGLAYHQWLICIGLGLTVYPINFLIKFIPDKVCCQMGKKKKIENEGSEHDRLSEHPILPQKNDKTTPGLDSHKERLDITPNREKSSGEEEHPLNEADA